MSLTGLKPRNLPSPWCWWLRSHSVPGKCHYPHYTGSSQDTDKPGYVCTTTTDARVDISEPLWTLPSCWAPHTPWVSGACHPSLVSHCKGRLDTSPLERAGKQSKCPQFSHWSEVAQGNYSCSSAVLGCPVSVLDHRIPHFHMFSHRESGRCQVCAGKTSRFQNISLIFLTQMA